MTPALWTSIPLEVSPCVTRSAIHALDWRVSCPITTRPVPPERFRSWPSARPIMYVLSWVKGNSPATPRIPSVPKSCRVWMVMLKGEYLKRECLTPSAWDDRHLLHDNRDSHRIGVHHLHQGIRNVSMPYERGPIHNSAGVDRIGDGGFNRLDPLARPADRDRRGCRLDVRDFVTRGEVPESPRAHRNLA